MRQAKKRGPLVAYTQIYDIRRTCVEKMHFANQLLIIRQT